MRKLLYNLIVSVLVISLSFMLASTALAGDPGLNGKNYVISTKTVGNKAVYFQHVAENLYSSTVDYVTYTVSRTKSFSGSLSGTVEASALVAKCSVTAEVGFGNSITETTACQWSIPGYSSYNCRYGSLLLKTTGTMQTWLNGTMTASRLVSANYSYVSFSDKIRHS